MSDYTKDDATHIARRMTSQSQINSEVDSDLLFSHSQLSRYSIYCLTGKEGGADDGDVAYGIMIQDHAKYWRTPKKGPKTIAITEDDEIMLFIDISKVMLDFAKNTIPSTEKDGILTYFMQRMLWPDNEDIRNVPKKKVEFEAGYQLWLFLGNTMTLTHQPNILNYRADMLLELKNALDIDIPSIGVEIDEDGHEAYDSNKEKERKEVIEYFDNILYRIPISRNASLEEIKDSDP